MGFPRTLFLTVAEIYHFIDSLTSRDTTAGLLCRTEKTLYFNGVQVEILYKKRR